MQLKSLFQIFKIGAFVYIPEEPMDEHGAFFFPPQLMLFILIFAFLFFTRALLFFFHISLRVLLWNCPNTNCS